jgi:hypothetical protein
MKPSEFNLRLGWYVLACLVAVFAYYYGLEGFFGGAPAGR